MQHADSRYTDIFEDTHTLTINFWWEDLDPISTGTLGVHTLVSQSGGRETVANIRLDNDRTWFFDSTPTNNSEFNMQQTLWRDLTATQQSDFYNNFGANIPATFETGYTGTAISGPAVGAFDLLSVVMHEVGHALGMSSANTSTIAQTGDNDYDFNPAFVFGQTLAAEVADGGNIAHLDDSNALMTPSISTGLRRLPSHTDLFSMASGHSYVSLDVLRREWYAGNSDFNTDSNWSGNTVPASADVTFVRNNGSAGTITAGLSANINTADLFVGEAANVDVNGFQLTVFGTATVDGLDSDFIIDAGGELAANEVIIQNQAEVFMTGGTLDVIDLTIDVDTDIRINGNATVDVANNMNNNGTLQSQSGATLTFSSVAAAPWDLDGTSGNGIVDARAGDINFASGALTDAFDGDIDIGNGTAAARTLTIAQPWTLGGGGVIDMSGGALSADRAAINGGTVTASSGDLNANAGFVHVNAPVVLSGTFDANVADGATLEFNGTVNVSGGNYNGTGTGNTRFDGITTYSGGTINFTNVLHQNGDTTVTVATTINGDIYNFDGGGALGHTFTLNNDLTLNVDEIDDSGEAFNSTLNINGSSTTLTVNTPNPWTLAGVTNIDTGTTSTFPSLSGSDVTLAGTINLDGGTRFDAVTTLTGNVVTFDAASTFALGGDALGLPAYTHRIAGGTVSGPGELRTFGDNQLHGFGTVSANVDFVGNSRLLADNGTLTISGTIVTLGDQIGTADTDGILNVTNAWNTNLANELRLNGGQVIGAAITNDGTTTGFGTVASANFNNNGDLTADGGLLTLNVDSADLDGSGEAGVLNAVSGNLDVLFTSTTGFGFDGTINVGSGRQFRMTNRALFNNGAINTTGGTVVNTSGFSQSGALTVNAGGVSQIDAPTIDFASAGTNTVNDNLRLEGAATIRNGATFGGAGRLIVNTASSLNIANAAVVGVNVLNQGRTAVGLSTGIATVAGFQQTGAGTFEVEIDGTNVGSQYDQLQVTGSAVLAGTLDVLINQNGGAYADPNVAGTIDQFEILLAASVTGTFGGFIYDGSTLSLTSSGSGMDRYHESDGLFRILNYDAGQVDLLNYKALLGDANGDLVVDGQDFIIWNSNKFQGGTDWLTGDFNGDGITDGQDFIIWNANKFTSVGFSRLASLGAASLNAVPEPTLGLWMCCGLFLSMLRLRRLS